MQFGPIIRSPRERTISKRGLAGIALAADPANPRR
jgi:hypothetical protein